MWDSDDDSCSPAELQATITNANHIMAMITTFLQDSTGAPADSPTGKAREKLSPFLGWYRENLDQLKQMPSSGAGCLPTASQIHILNDHVQHHLQPLGRWVPPPAG